MTKLVSSKFHNLSQNNKNKDNYKLMFIKSWIMFLTKYKIDSNYKWEHRLLFIASKRKANICTVSCAKRQQIITVKIPKCQYAVHNVKKIIYCTYQKSISLINSSVNNSVSLFNNYYWKTGTMREVPHFQWIILLLFTLFHNINLISKYSTVK